jgi:hypothetical protein
VEERERQRVKEKEEEKGEKVTNDHVRSSESAVRKSLPLHVDTDVNVGSATGVVTREDGGELSESVLVGRPGAAKERLMVVGTRVLREETLARSLVSGTLPLEDGVLVGMTSVVTGRVGAEKMRRKVSSKGKKREGRKRCALPEVNKRVLERLAGVYIDETDVHELKGGRRFNEIARKEEAEEETHEEKSELVLSHVLADRVSLGVVVRTLSQFGSDCE